MSPGTLKLKEGKEGKAHENGGLVKYFLNRTSVSQKTMSRINSMTLMKLKSLCTTHKYSQTEETACRAGEILC